jgi:excisionase family DNA binding protein
VSELLSGSDLLTLQEAADYLKVGVSTLYNNRRSLRVIPAVRVGKFLRYRRSDLIEWLEAGATAEVTRRPYKARGGKAVQS